MCQGPAGAGGDTPDPRHGREFIAGADLLDALPVLRRLWDSGVASSVDILARPW